MYDSESRVDFNCRCEGHREIGEGPLSLDGAWRS